MSRRLRRRHWGLISPTCAECGGLIGLLKGGPGCTQCARWKREAQMLVDRISREDQVVDNRLKNIKVPDQMLAAVDKAIGEARMSKASCAGVPEGSPELWPSEIKRITLEAVLFWLSNNPIIPTPEQMMEIVRSRFEDRVTISACCVVATEWQRRMFLAPEQSNPVVDKVKQTLLGSTLTAGDAVELMDAVRRCTSPEERS